VADRDQNETRLGFPDLLTGLAGIGTLLVAAYVLSDGAFHIPNPTWLLAGGALLVGILLLASSLRGKR
jgi:hypothetical protein